MDMNYGQENASQFSFTTHVPPPASIPQSPISSNSLHSHTMSTESANPLFPSDISALNFTQEQPGAAAVYSRPASSVHSPIIMATFPPPANVPYIDSVGRHRGSSFTSPPITSPSRSGFETPLTPSESLHGRNATTTMLPTDSAHGISFSTSDLVTMSVLEGYVTFNGRP